MLKKTWNVTRTLRMHKNPNNQKNYWWEFFFYANYKKRRCVFGIYVLPT